MKERVPASQEDVAQEVFWLAHEAVKIQARQAVGQNVGCYFDDAGLVEAGDGGLEDHFWNADALDVEVDLVRFRLAAGVKGARAAEEGVD